MLNENWMFKPIAFQLFNLTRYGEIMGNKMVGNGGFLEWGGTKNGWFSMENPIKMDDLVAPPFWESSKYCWRKDC